ncbi:sugar phosphate nucleotidyltransferase [Pelagibacteraceae bacterium]|nr:sugar phosphate nucleotidyltransferase [Pelagibacteraceae bacterium]
MKIIILCGGLGSRLSEETRLIPKPMVKIGKLPIIKHIMNIYNHYGFNDFILATGYKNKVIENYFKNKKNIKCIFTGKSSLTGGRLLRLKKFFLPNENFMLTYGDGLTNQNIKKLLKFHIKHKKIATLTSVKPPARFGEVFIKGNKVVKFEEKSQMNKNWINGGFFVFNYKIFKFISGDQTMLEREPLTRLSRLNQLMAFKHSGFWQCMDTMRDKNIMKNLYLKKNAPWVNLKN